MRSNSALRKVEEAMPEADKAEDFVRELATLSHKHGIGITGDPVLFVLEQDDGNLAYQVSADSKLAITSA